MSDSHSDVPNVRIIPPSVYLAGIVVGILINIWIPTKIVPNSLAWTLGGILMWVPRFGLIAPPVRSSS
jgi:hypothetical protein